MAVMTIPVAISAAHYDLPTRAQCIDDQFDIEARVIYAQDYVIEINQQRDFIALQALRWFQVVSTLFVNWGTAKVETGGEAESRTLQIARRIENNQKFVE
jgi:hypothetical protein